MAPRADHRALGLPDRRRRLLSRWHLRKIRRSQTVDDARPTIPATGKPPLPASGECRRLDPRGAGARSGRARALTHIGPHTFALRRVRAYLDVLTTDLWQPLQDSSRLQ